MVQPGLCGWLWIKLGTGDQAMRPCMHRHSASFSWHTVLLLLARSRAVIKTWRVDKLTVINKLKINDLILLLSSTNGTFLRYMRVFRIIKQNVHVKCLGGIFYVRIYAFKTAIQFIPESFNLGLFLPSSLRPMRSSLCSICKSSLLLNLLPYLLGAHCLNSTNPHWRWIRQ